AVHGSLQRPYPDDAGQQQRAGHTERGHHPPAGPPWNRDAGIVVVAALEHARIWVAEDAVAAGDAARERPVGVASIGPETDLARTRERTESARAFVGAE